MALVYPHTCIYYQTVVLTGFGIHSDFISCKHRIKGMKIFTMMLNQLRLLSIDD